MSQASDVIKKKKKARKKAAYKKALRSRKLSPLTVFLIAVLVIGLCFIIVWKVFVVKNVKVDGTDIYDKATIEQYVLDDKYSWNSLYVFLKYKFYKPEQLPFMDSFTVTLTAPDTIAIKMEEEEMIGYIYNEETGENVYIDRNGTVKEISEVTLKKVTRVNNIEIESAEMGKKLKATNAASLPNLLNVALLLDKHDLVPDDIELDNSSVIVNFDSIEVKLGTSDYLNDKIMRMEQIMPELEGEEGTLHLENWNEENTDIYFKKNANN